jgi:hypothetical protein
MIDGGTSTHSNQCTYCHVNTDTDGRLVDGLTGTAAGDVGDATVHTWGTTSSCAKCHGSHDASFTTGHGNDETHANLLTSANCDGCHTGDMITASLTHGNGSVGECTYCHASTDTDGSLVNGATGTASNDVGDAQVHAWGSTSSCAKCHEDGSSYTYSTDFASHIVQDHDGVTGTTNSEPIKDCNNCHTGDIIRVVHNTPDCVDCHVNSTTNGERLVIPLAQRVTASTVMRTAALTPMGLTLRHMSTAAARIMTRAAPVLP